MSEAITKAAQALRDLADWHWSQATTLRKAASTTAMDTPEPCRSSLLRMADWHDDQKRLLAALQDKAVGAREPTLWISQKDLDRLKVTTVFRPLVSTFKPLNDGEVPLFAAHPAPVVPEGFAIVPVEPTPEMRLAGKRAIKGSETTFEGLLAVNAWSAMLAASQQKGKQ